MCGRLSLLDTGDCGHMVVGESCWTAGHLATAWLPGLSEISSVVQFALPSKSFNSTTDTIRTDTDG